MQSRRDFLRIGGASLCGVSLLDVLRAQSRAAGAPAPKAKQMIVCWMAGGPPHTDMFDMKPDSGTDYKGEFKPIKTNLPGLDVCELMPRLAKIADKYTVIRSITTMNNPGDHSRAPMYWLTGNPRLPSGTEKFPLYGSVISKVRPGPPELPSFTVLGKIDHHINNSIAGSYLGPAYSPFIFDPLASKDDIAKMLAPQMELPAFAKQTELLAALDSRLRRQESIDPLIAGLDKYQQTAFDMLRSPKLRAALDLSKESEETIKKYKTGHLEKYRYPSGDPLHFLLARRLIEAGAPIVHFGLGYWDWHGENFVAGRQQIPMFDNALSLLLTELDERGLLDTTIVLALGEMGRKPKCGTEKNAGRDHWDYAQFVLAAGGGFKRGCVVGATDKLGEQVTQDFYKVESFGRTLYHLLGIDPDTVMRTPSNRPIKLIAEDAPLVKEALVWRAANFGKSIAGTPVMQFRLRSLFILTAIVCVYFGVLNAPPFIAIPLYCAIVWLMPAYWIAGVIYAREARRAFFIGGLASGTVPFVVLIFFSLAVVMEGWGPWGYRNYGGRGGFYGEYQLMNLMSSLFIFAPVMLAFVGGWISWGVYHGVQPPKPVSPPTSPFVQTFPMASPPAGERPSQALVSTSGSPAPRQSGPG